MTDAELINATGWHAIIMVRQVTHFRFEGMSEQDKKLIPEFLSWRETNVNTITDTFNKYVGSMSSLAPKMKGHNRDPEACAIALVSTFFAGQFACFMYYTGRADSAAEWSHGRGKGVKIILEVQSII